MTVAKVGDTWAVDFYPKGRRGPRVRRRGFKSKAEAMAFERGGYAAPEKAPLRLLDLARLWFEFHGQSLKDARYRYSRTLAICERLGNPYIADFTATDFVEYRGRRLSDVSVHTVNHEHRYLRAMFSELVRLDIIKVNPIGNVRQLKTDQTELTFLSLDQCSRLLAECQGSTNPYTYPVALLCLATGARWGEAEALTHSAIHGGKVHYHRTKNGSTRAVPVSDDVLQVVFSSCLPGPGRLFRSCRSAFRAAYSRCGFDTPGQLTHILRHTFASHFMMAGGDVLTLQRILGHGNIQMTMRYAHLSPDHLDAAMRFNPLVQLNVVKM